MNSLGCSEGSIAIYSQTKKENISEDELLDLLKINGLEK